MKSVVFTVILFMLSCFGSTNGSYQITLKLVEDVTLEGSTNLNDLQFLIVGSYSGSPKKRALLRFEDLPYGCESVVSATMYIYYLYSDKGSCSTNAQSSSFLRTIRAYRVLSLWREKEATITRRTSYSNWHTTFVGLNNIDATSSHVGQVTINPSSSTRGFVRIGVTDAVKAWHSGSPNYGVVIRATNEHTAGHDIRFASNADCDANRHAYIDVYCLSYSPTPTPTPTPSYYGWS